MSFSSVALKSFKGFYERENREICSFVPSEERNCGCPWEQAEDGKVQGPETITIALYPRAVIDQSCQDFSQTYVTPFFESEDSFLKSVLWNELATLSEMRFTLQRWRKTRALGKVHATKKVHERLLEDV